MDAATQHSNPVKSGAAGAATFPGSDSRKFNYFEPKGRKATHYEDMTVDVQPDPERYLLRIGSFRSRTEPQPIPRTGHRRGARIGISSAPSIRNGSALTISGSRRSAAWFRASSKTRGNPAPRSAWTRPGSRSCKIIWAPGSTPNLAWAHQ
jgi:hypothetical protein